LQPKSPGAAGQFGPRRDPLRGLRVDGARLLALLDELATIGADPAGGLSRLGFGPADNAARRHLAGVAAAAGLASRVDEAGNVFVFRRGRAFPADRPILLLGSHLDTVRRGGSLDGAYGVVAAVEVLRTLDENGIELRNEPVAVAFANEEGALFPQPFWGSMAMTGALREPGAATDRNGTSIRAALAEAGGDLDRIEAARWPAGRLAAFLELHVEQGPVLAEAGIPIGVVTAVVGRTILDVTVSGSQNHAGTTPMDRRADALAAAAELVLAVEELARYRQECAVATVGALRAEPGQTNVVPGRVELTVELRDADPARLRAGEAELLKAFDELAGRRGVGVDSNVTLRSSPVQTSAHLREAVQDAAAALDLACRPLPSGAGHDAQIMAGLAPSGMIFVPSTGGVSHAPEEHTDPRLLVSGADTLLQTALRA